MQTVRERFLPTTLDKSTAPSSNSGGPISMTCRPSSVVFITTGSDLVLIHLWKICSLMWFYYDQSVLVLADIIDLISFHHQHSKGPTFLFRFFQRLFEKYLLQAHKFMHFRLRFEVAIFPNHSFNCFPIFLKWILSICLIWKTNIP